MVEQSRHPLEYLSMLKRRWRWFLVPLAASSAVGVALALMLPPTFRSSATIAVQAPAVVADLVQAQTGLDRTERLRALSQQLRSRAVLERVVREEALAGDRPMDVVIQDLVSRISVEIPKPIARTPGEPELNAFDIVYLDGTAERARRVTDRLAHVFTEEHSRSREIQAEGTADFLAAQVTAGRERLAGLEKRLRAAKELHMGALPEQTLANLQTVAGLRQQLESTHNSILSERDRLTLTERQIQAIRKSGGGTSAGAPGAASPLQRVLALEGQLSEARARYTEKHPEVQRLEEELKGARVAATTTVQPAAETRLALVEGDPAYQHLVAESNLTRLRIAALQRTETQLRADIGRFQQRVDSAPMVEQSLSSLQREFDLETENHKQLAEKHSAALVREQIARSRGNERFSVLSAASLPDSPESPNRLRIMGLAIALGLMLGAGLAFGREFLDGSVRDSRGLQSEFGVPVLVEIPRLPTAG
jgi:polysaccharide chain length determinant protein (PEP-CTERM system associated)